MRPNELLHVHHVGEGRGAKSQLQGQYFGDAKSKVIGERVVCAASFINKVCFSSVARTQYDRFIWREKETAPLYT